MLFEHVAEISRLLNTRGLCTSGRFIPNWHTHEDGFKNYSDSVADDECPEATKDEMEPGTRENTIVE